MSRNIYKFKGSIKLKIKLDTVNDASMISTLANKYKECDIDCKCGRYIIDLKSIMGILSLGLPKTVEVIIQSDDDKLIDRIKKDLHKWEVV